MTNRPPPTLPKWIFIVADILLLAVCAWTIQQVLPSRTTASHVILALAIIVWMVGAFICVWPWILEFKAQTQHYDNESLTTALQQIQRLEEIGARVQTATASWQSAQDAAMRVTTTARELEEKIRADSKEFMEFAERIHNDEKQHLRLEVEKLRRAEAEWLQVAARMLDHTYALTQAAQRSGQPNLATQMTNFQSACRDAARRVGLVPFHPEVGEPFDERSQQTEDPNAKPDAGAVITDILATGYSFQGQLLRKALVRVTQEGQSSEPAAPAEEAAATPQPKPEPPAESAPPPEVPMFRDQVTEPQAAAVPEPQPEVPVFRDQLVAEDQIVEVATPSIEQPSTTPEPQAADQPAAEEAPKPRRQRRPDPQASLPF
jgi:molecular chaperone GrpE (heat shock protein)